MLNKSEQVLSLAQPLAVPGGWRRHNDCVQVRIQPPWIVTLRAAGQRPPPTGPHAGFQQQSLHAGLEHDVTCTDGELAVVQLVR